MVISTLTISLEQDFEDDPAGIAYSDRAFYVLRERSEYLGNEYCYVYRRAGHGRIRMSGPLDGLAPAIAFIERLQKEEAATPIP